MKLDFLKNLKKIEVASLIILLLTWLTILNLYFSFNSETKEVKFKIDKLSKEVELSSNFNSLAYLNYAEPIFTTSANDVNSLLQKYFNQGGVQITQSRYETIRKIISEAKSKILEIAPPSEETVELKSRIIDYYDKYLTNIFNMIGLTKNQLETIKNEKGEIYAEIEKMKNMEMEIGAIFRIIAERYKK